MEPIAGQVILGTKASRNLSKQLTLLALQLLEFSFPRAKAREVTFHQG